MLRILVCGDRNFAAEEVVRRRLAELPKQTEVIEGGARGADRLAGAAAETLGLGHRCIPAEWRRYGRGAGPIRNRAMLDLGPVRVIAFHDDLDSSRGTADCVREARRRGIPVEVIDSTGELKEPPEGGSIRRRSPPLVD